MTASPVRMTEPGPAPTPAQLEAWLGKRAYGRWRRMAEAIADRYPGVFTPEWLFGGRKHGWSLRYKKGKSFCTLVPERRRVALVIVFGAAERAAAAACLMRLSSATRNSYGAAPTYADGKWLLLDLDSNQTAADAEILLAVK